MYLIHFQDFIYYHFNISILFPSSTGPHVYVFYSSSPCRHPVIAFHEDTIGNILIDDNIISIRANAAGKIISNALVSDW